ncbi:MAG TPA: hypothetical protein VFL69_00875, partial [Marmoricola sp.]|nr:hypothetical protein [Marmoricola sp.]
WFMEGTAVWMEHQVYPGTRDFLQYLPVSAIAQPGVPVDKFDDYEYHQYGAFVFWEYLSERFGRKAVRDVWQRAAVHRESNPYSLQAARREVAAHGQDFTSFFAGFARWNTLPAHSYAMHNAYAARVRPPWGLTHTFSRSRPRMAARQTTLKHLSSSNVRFRPAPTLGRKARLRILLDLPNRSHGPAATVQVHHQDGSVGWRRVRLSRTGAARATVPFNPRKVRDVVVVLSNTSTRMVSCSTTSGTYSCGGHGAYDSNQAYRISAWLR